MRARLAAAQILGKALPPDLAALEFKETWVAPGRFVSGAGLVPLIEPEVDIHSETKAEAEAQWEIVADALREKQPKLGALMDASRDDVLAYMSFPREHWAQIASTNPLERVNREIKRRADVIGIFPNDGAIIRLVGALMLETNDEWTVARRYMSLETIARITDNPTARLPAVAT